MKAEETSRWVSGFEAVDRRAVAVVGGKGANLGELLRIDGVRVPAGFCVTTDAFRSVLAAAPSIDDRLARLSRLRADDLDGIRTESAALREAIAALTLPDDIAAAITGSLERLGERRPYAVRSSATAEDLPDASSAGVHDTFLDVVGRAAVLERVRRCWASLFTERAVAYRLRGGVDHRQVQMAVVVQRMVAARAAGVLFTVDPLTSNRRVAAVEASAGLGEALVSGRLNPDRYRVRDGGVVARSIAGERPALRDAEVVELVAMGRRIAAHFGAPQDLEWCLDDEGFHFVQSRPVTALFPIPALDDGEKHVFLSVGHQQMMTDPMRPLGLSVWQMTALRPMYEAAGRLFVDVTPGLRSPAIRRGLLELFGRSDPLTRDAIETLLDRGDFVPVQEGEAVTGPPAVRADPPAIACDPAVVAELVERDQASIAALRRDLASV
ncbi:MAG TPA: PEP/pyruvate-binding domain-containing protein, partial [Nannocystaceae bacterium]|nr:PEP/pyruvate-binding domain-containing protein [Nannocystaceae bacterium]